jgi:hypothetical protein
LGVVDSVGRAARDACAVFAAGVVIFASVPIFGVFVGDVLVFFRFLVGAQFDLSTRTGWRPRGSWFIRTAWVVRTEEVVEPALFVSIKSTTG